MNKRIRKKKMKQYAKQHNIELGKVPKKLPPILLSDWNPNEYVLRGMISLIPPKPILQINHV